VLLGGVRTTDAMIEAASGGTMSATPGGADPASGATPAGPGAAAPLDPVAAPGADDPVAAGPGRAVDGGAAAVVVERGDRAVVVAWPAGTVVVPSRPPTTPGVVTGGADAHAAPPTMATITPAATATSA
jgi:hypothetical protein